MIAALLAFRFLKREGTPDEPFIFLALILVCPPKVSIAECDETTAVDVLSTRVASEIGCNKGWQEIFARSALKEDLDGGAYLKVICRRIRSDRP